MGRTYGVATDDVRYRTLTPENDSGSVTVGRAGQTTDITGTVTVAESSDTLGFYGLSTPIAKPSVTQQTTKTSTALRADIDRINTALSNLGLISVT